VVRVGVRDEDFADIQFVGVLHEPFVQQQILAI